jgi:signal transduction histidine kinase
VSNKFEADVRAVQGNEAVARILDVVCSVTGMGFAAVARVTPDRWVALAVRDSIRFGLKPGGELRVDTTICNEIRHTRAPVVIEHVAEDDNYRGHPTPKMYGFQSYISVPIILGGGQFYGTLCAIDPEPRKLNTPQIVGMFTLFAELIARQLDSDEQLATGNFHLASTRADLANSRADLATSEASLSDARNTGKLREEFIAVLGHDLRNPLAAVQSGIRLLSKQGISDEQRRVVTLMQGSVLRMSGLIDNLLDFARGRLGGGLLLGSVAETRIELLVRHIVEELRSSFPDRAIETHIDVKTIVDCDPRRIGQLVSNLLANALTHGTPDRPVVVRAEARRDAFELSVSNEGAAIPDPVMSQLFQPFYRGEVRLSQQGLGLGLYIASEIARAHGGTLTAESTPAETRFTFRMPNRAA